MKPRYLAFPEKVDVMQLPGPFLLLLAPLGAITVNAAR